MQKEVDIIKIKESADFISKKIKDTPKVAIILGSGLGTFASHIQVIAEIKYEEIPHFPVSTVKGHAGKFIYGMVGNVPVLAMSGRFHYYEGYNIQTVTYPVYVMKELGIAKLIVTNAAGGINPDFAAGGLMLITDHINMFGTNPLIGPNNDQLGERFPDMSEPYDREFISIAADIAKNENISCYKGIFLGTTGPSFETAAEIRMMRVLGGDAVAMSTVPEVIVANYLKMRVLGISCITNMGTGMSTTGHSHQDVIATASRVESQFCNLVYKTIEKICDLA